MAAPVPKRPRKTGRPSLFTEDRRKRILDALSAGNYMSTAAKFAGIGESTLYQWLDRGTVEKERLEYDPSAEPDAEEQPYAEFLEAVQKARGVAEARNVALIQESAKRGTWQAAAWWLERSFPARWGRRDLVEHSGVDGGAVEVNVTVTAEELEHKVAEVLRARRPSERDKD